MTHRLQKLHAAQAGRSIVEILIVILTILILSSVAIPYMWNYKKLYKSEDQALRIIDLMREAAQTAIVKRRTIRFEIDLTDNSVLLIDESQSGPQGTMWKKIPLELTRDVRVDQIPAGISKPNPPNYNDITFAVDSVGHKVGATTVTGHNIWACRFKADGSVVNASGTPISANIYVWPPVNSGSTTPRNSGEVRAITMAGASGAVRYWKWVGSSFKAYQ